MKFALTVSTAVIFALAFKLLPNTLPDTVAKLPVSPPTNTRLPVPVSVAARSVLPYHLKPTVLR